MAIIVVCGSGKDVGKTALVCGLIAGLKELGWTAVKVTSHIYGKAEAVWEETSAGQGTDTARYLAAGARRALLVSAGDNELGAVVERLMAEFGSRAHLIFESNRILNHLRPDVCVAVEGGAAQKGSFVAAARQVDARVELAEADGFVDGDEPVFRLRALDRISAEMAGWLRGRLSAS